MSDVVIILAGGDNKRWGGVKKYLLPVNGEPVIERTTRLCREFLPGVEPIVIGPKGHRQSPNEALLCTVDRWSQDGYTYLMLGDVSWKRGTLREFLKPDGLRVYGRSGSNQITGRPSPEVFGMRFPRENWRRVLRSHLMATWFNPDGDWWDVFVLLTLDSWDGWLPDIATHLIRPMRDWVYYHMIYNRARAFRSPIAVDLEESVTDDFDEPEWYQPYCEKCGPLLEGE